MLSVQFPLGLKNPYLHTGGYYEYRDFDHTWNLYFARRRIYYYIGRIPVCRPGTENHSENKIWSFLVLLTKFSSTL